MNKRGSPIIIAVILVIMITIASATAMFYWLNKMQGQMQGGAEQSESELTERVTGKIDIVTFDYNARTDYATVTIKNSGSRDLKDIGTTDSLIIFSKDSSCKIGFNSSTCIGCPFDLDVGEVKIISINFRSTDCESISEGIEYRVNFALKKLQAQTSFTPATTYEDQWELLRLSTKPTGRKYHAMSIIDGSDKVLLFGGDDNTNNCDGSTVTYCNGTWIYDYGDNKWSRGITDTSLVARRGHAMASVDGTDQVVIFAGEGTGGGDEIWIYDLSDGVWTQVFPASSPSPRQYAAMAPIGGSDKVLLFGGFGNPNCDESGSQYCNATWAYDLSDDAWTQMTTPVALTARKDFAMAAIDGTDKVLLFGGDDGSRLSDTWIYDFSDGAWTQKTLATSPAARQNHAMATIANTDQVVMFGGDDGTYDDETWVYDLSDNAWTQKTPANSPSARGYPAIATIYNSNKVLLFGGEHGDYSSESWLYIT